MTTASMLPGKGVRRLYAALFIVMTFTGMGQMPIFKRYYISDIPGMGWSADFYLTHTIHYLGAVLLLGLFAYLAADYLLSVRRRYRLSAAGMIRVLLLAGIVVTGIFRVLKNLPDVTFSPGFTLFIDIAHLGFMMVFLLAVLVFAIAKRRWVEERKAAQA